MNGLLVGETKNAELDLAKLFDYNTAEKNKLYIGKSLADSNIYLNAKLHDFRIYRVPLTDKQITRIYNNALKEGQEEESGEEQTADLPKFAARTPQLYNQFLTSVEDVKVETVNMVRMAGKAVNRAVNNRGTRTRGKRNDFKKAYVVVAKGQTIPVFAAVEEETK